MKHRLLELERRLIHAAGDAWCISTEYCYEHRGNSDYDEDEADRLENLVEILGNAARDVRIAIKVIEAVQISDEICADCDENDYETRYAWGNREADNLTAKLREINPTVKVTYKIDADNGEDVVYLSYDGMIGAIFNSFEAAEEYFHRAHDTDDTDEEND